MDNTTKNKEKLFAQYWGQKYEYRNEFGRFFGHVGDFHFSRNVLDINKSCTLNLKSLSSITDEDAIVVSRFAMKGKIVNKILRRSNRIAIHMVDNINTNQKYMILIWFKSSNVFVYELLSGEQNIVACWDQCFIFDFLRSKGYALPWMGVSVQQQIEYGWIKLQDHA